MATRCKFLCRSVEDYGMSKKVNLGVVYAPDANGENASFTKATPAGECWMTIDNPAASVQFVPGKFYYCDFTEFVEIPRELPKEKYRTPTDSFQCGAQ